MDGGRKRRKTRTGPRSGRSEVYPRYGASGAVYILVNLSKIEQTVSLPSAMNDVLEGGSKQSVKLAVYGVAVLSGR